MSSVLAPEVRIVKCPKCENLLTEHPHFDVYACGGCGTTLQAKKRRSKDVNSRSSSLETEAAQRNAADHVSRDQELSHSIQEANGSSSGECHMHESSERDTKEIEECNEEQLGHVNLSDGEQKNQMEINNSSDLRIEEHVDSEKDCSNDASTDSVLKGENSEAEADNPNSPSMGAEELNDENYLSAGAEEELNCPSEGEDANNEKSAELDVVGCDSINKSSSTENLVADTENISQLTVHKPEESISHVDPVSSPTEQPTQAETNRHHSFDHVRSMDTFASEPINPSSELSGTLGEMSKSPTTRSYHAYDGSISSCDGMEEGSPSQHLKPFDDSYTAVNVVSEGRSRRGKAIVNRMTYGDLETQEDSMNLTSDFPNRRHHVIEDTERKKSKVLETTRHDHPVQNRLRTERDYYLPRMPFHRSDPKSSYESGSPSNQLLDEFYGSSSFLSPDAFEDPEQEKVKLLRMIYKLQDQLNRNGETNGRRSTGVSYNGKHISSYHSHDLHERRFFHSVDYPRYNGRYNHGINWPQRRNSSRIPFSAEATSSTHHVEHSCFHCRQCSTELPTHVICQHEELCRFHQGHNFHFSHRSYPSSPQLFVDSRLPLYSRSTKSGDQRHMAPEVKKYFREKEHLPKRHFRPVAGGAPFVTCYKCLKLLQLPADFLLFKKVFHQLKCGSCSEVLKFSLQNKSHIVSYAPSVVGPPPSELNDQSEEISRSILPSPSHAKHNPNVDPVSYSDNYSEYGRSVSRSTFGSVKGKGKIASRHSSTSKASVATYEPAGLSSDLSGSRKLSSKMELGRPVKTLHKLMGYSSPSQVIRGIRASFASRSSRSMANMDDLN